MDSLGTSMHLHYECNNLVNSTCLYGALFFKKEGLGLLGSA